MEKNSLKVGQKLKKGQTLGMSYFGKNLNFQKTVLLPMNTNCGANFSKIGPYLGELGPKNAQKWAISWMLHRHKNISNFLT